MVTQIPTRKIPDEIAERMKRQDLFHQDTNAEQNRNSEYEFQNLPPPKVLGAITDIAGFDKVTSQKSGSFQIQGTNSGMPDGPRRIKYMVL